MNNFYDNEEWNVSPPEEIQFDKLKRHVLFEKPRITKFNISWDQTKPAEASGLNNNFMFDENYSNIQNEFKNIDYNNYNNKANDAQNTNDIYKDFLKQKKYFYFPFG